MSDKNSNSYVLPIESMPLVVVLIVIVSIVSGMLPHLETYLDHRRGGDLTYETIDPELNDRLMIVVNDNRHPETQ